MVIVQALAAPDVRVHRAAPGAQLGLPGRHRCCHQAGQTSRVVSLSLPRPPHRRDRHLWRCRDSCGIFVR
eukprot:6029713-Pyramimonas_sp.AAC.1